MKILDKAIRIITLQKKTTFEELNDFFLVVLGISAFLIAGYWGLMLGEVVPEFIKVVNKSGISSAAIALTILLGGFGVNVWFFGCISARCHSLIYERWLK